MRQLAANWALVSRPILFVCLLCLPGAGEAGADTDTETVVNLLTDVSHEYSFNLSWADRNQRDIYPGVNCLTSLRTIHRTDLANINALVLLVSARLPYSPDDASHVLRYVEDGGGVLLSVKTGGAYRNSMNDFLRPFGVEVPEGDSGKTQTAGTIAATRHPAALPGTAYRETKRTPLVFRPKKPMWSPVYETADGESVVVTRRYGRGVIIVDTSGLYVKADRQDKNAMGIVRKLLEYMASGKKLPATKGGGGWQGSSGYHWDLIKTTDDGLRIHHTDYTTMYVDNDITAYHRCADYLHQLSGLTVEMKAAQIKEKRDREAATFAGAAIDVDVSAVKELLLETTDGGDGKHADHSVWGDAELTDRQGRRTKLSLDAALEAKSGYGKPTQDAHGEVPISIGGVPRRTGIYIHAPSQMRFRLDGKQARFSAHVGCQDTFRGSVGFRVIGDARVLWESPIAYRGGVPGGDPSDINYLPEGVLFRIRYLACRGAGFLLPQGAAVDLAKGLENDWQVHLGMFAHEMGHAWSYPYCEKMGEEASAFIFNNLVLHRHHGQRHPDSVTKRLTNYLKKDTLDAADLAKKPDNFKYYMFIDLMIREYGEDIWKNYNLLKYALLNKAGAAWTPHTAAWLWSIAAGTDVFPYLQTAFGTSVSKTEAELPANVMALGFVPEAVGKLCDIPLERLPRQRVIFDRLHNFSDVREFYRREIAEKGHPKVEG